MDWKVKLMYKRVSYARLNLYSFSLIEVKRYYNWK